MELRLDRITIKDGRRTIDANKVKELADSMNQVGLLNPITINKGYELVAGAHRLKAAELLGWQEINCIIMDADELTCELAEIDENLMRNELHYIDRGIALKRRDELLTEAGMRAKAHRPTNEEKSEIISPLITTEHIAKQLGVSQRTVEQEKQIATNVLPEVQDAIKAADLPKTDALKIARLEPEEQIKVADRLNEGAKSYNSIIQTIRREETQDPAKLPEHKYQIIYCDPPWQYSNSGLNGSAQDHYNSMSLNELKAMPVKTLYDENATMLMWATNPMLKDALELMASWGFDYKTNMVWVKEKQNYGKLGFYVYGKHELLLIGTKGAMVPLGEKPVSVITGENNIHSKKPEAVYEIIEAMYPGMKYIELFSRNTPREGWYKWGNEVGKYD